MRQNLPGIGFIAGVVVLIIGTVSLRYTWRQLAIRGRIFLAVAGIAIGVALVAFGNYSISSKLHIMGFPFMSAAFQKRDGYWEDFVGPLTVPALLANAYVGFTVPFIGAALWVRSRSRVAY